MAADSKYSQPHEKTVRAAATPYGCHNRKPFAPGYWVTVRFYFTGGQYELRSEFIRHTGSTGCRSSELWDTDLRCRGCTAEKDHEYAEYMKGMK